jgi:wobble nucleotide-excising tRNase
MNLFRVIIVIALSFLVSQNLITNVITDQKGNIEIIKQNSELKVEIKNKKFKE